MNVRTYREPGGFESKVSSFSVGELMRSEKNAHFTSFSVDLVGVVVDRENGRYHLDMYASGQREHDYYILCMSSNSAGRFVLEYVKGILLKNNEAAGSTSVSVYAAKGLKEMEPHSLSGPILYAKADVDVGTELHYRISGAEYFDYIYGEYRNSTTINIHYLSPDYYSRDGKRNQITTNIVLSNMEISKGDAEQELRKMIRGHAEYVNKNTLTDFGIF